MARAIISGAIIDALKGLNIGDTNNIRRVVLDIDCTANSLITAYVEHYTDPEGTVQLIRALSSVEVALVKSDPDVTCTCPSFYNTTDADLARGEIHTVAGPSGDCPIHGLDGTEPTYREVRH